MPDDFTDRLRKDRKARDDHERAEAAKREADDAARRREAVQMRERLQQLDGEVIASVKSVEVAYKEDRGVYVEYPGPDSGRRVFRIVTSGGAAYLRIVLDLRNLRFEMEQQPPYGVGPNSVLGRYENGRLPTRAAIEDAIQRFLADPMGPITLK